MVLWIFSPSGVQQAQGDCKLSSGQAQLRKTSLRTELQGLSGEAVSRLPETPGAKNLRIINKGLPVNILAINRYLLATSCLVHSTISSFQNANQSSRRETGIHQTPEMGEGLVIT